MNHILIKLLPKQEKRLNRASCQIDLGPHLPPSPCSMYDSLAPPCATPSLLWALVHPSSQNTLPHFISKFLPVQYPFLKETVPDHPSLDQGPPRPCIVPRLLFYSSMCQFVTESCLTSPPNSKPRDVELQACFYHHGT